MSRREFSKAVKRAAKERAGGLCEGWTPAGTICGAKLTTGKFHYDHVIPDGNGGEPVLSNCAVICVVCHKYKTTRLDVPAIAKTKRISDKHNGIRSSRAKIQSAGFRKSEPQHTASRPIVRNFSIHAVVATSQGSDK